MSFLDTIRDKLRANPDENGYYDDQGYDDDGYYDDAAADGVGAPEPRSRGVRDAQDRAGQGQGGSLLGNTSRPEAESVSVYTRSGRPVGTNAATTDFGTGPGHGSAYRRGADVSSGATGTWSPTRDYGAPSYAPQTPTRDYGATPAPSYAPAPSYVPSPSQLGTSNGPTPGDIGLTPIPRMSSGQLPPYVLKPTAYDDVQMVIRRVRTNQPVVLSFKSTNIETAKRILDFCFGLSCGVGGSVEELGDRVFVVQPAGIALSQADVDKLVADGVLKR